MAGFALEQGGVEVQPVAGDVDCHTEQKVRLVRSVFTGTFHRNNRVNKLSLKLGVKLVGELLGQVISLY